MFNRSFTKKINKIDFFSFNTDPKKCKVIEVKLDLSCIIIFTLNKKLYKWHCILDNLPKIKSLYYKIELEKLLLNKELKIVISKYDNNIVYGIIYDGKKNINSYFSVLIHSEETKEGLIKISKKPIINRIPLETIHENCETIF